MLLLDLNFKYVDMETIYFNVRIGKRVLNFSQKQSPSLSFVVCGDRLNADHVCDEELGIASEVPQAIPCAMWTEEHRQLTCVQSTADLRLTQEGCRKGEAASEMNTE